VTKKRAKRTTANSRTRQPNPPESKQPVHSHQEPSHVAAPIGAPRIAALDVLRGLAILLMIVDHAAYYLWNVPIAPTSLRIVTRLSMPLFCGLMGYFLAYQANINWKRFYQLCLATVLVNLAFYTVHQKVEILASLLVCYVLYLCVGNWLALAAAAVFLTPFDPTQAWFDYPLPLVAACVAQGIIVRCAPWNLALVTAGLITLGASIVQPPSQYVLFYVVPATLSILWGSRRAAGTQPQPPAIAGLGFVGRHPLAIYLSQYFVLLAVSADH
jgi:uncharacterized membrane protein